MINIFKFPTLGSAKFVVERLSQMGLKAAYMPSGYIRVEDMTQDAKQIITESLGTHVAATGVEDLNLPKYAGTGQGKKSMASKVEPAKSPVTANRKTLKKYGNTAGAQTKGDLEESVEQELDENAAFIVGINALAQKIAPLLPFGVRKAIVVAVLGGVALPFVMDRLAHETNKIRDEARLLYDYLKKELKKMKGQKSDTGTTQKPLESPKAANTTDLTKRKFKGESVEQIAEVFKSGDTVKVPHKGKMVRGKIIRYDDGGTGKARQSGGGYVVDVGEPASILVPAQKVVKEEVEQIEELTDFQKNTLNIARKTVKYADAILGVMGGMTKKQAHEFLLRYGTTAEKTAAAKYLGRKESLGVQMAEEENQQIEEAYYSKAGATPLFVPAKFVYDEFFAKVRESGMMFNRLKAESALEYIFGLMHNPKSSYSKYQGMDILHASALEHYRKIMGLRKEEVEVAEEWKSLKKTKVDLNALRKQGYKVSVQHGEGDTLYRVSKTKSNKPVKKEENEQIDELSNKTKASYIAKRGSQLQRMTTGLDHYRNLLTGRQQANAVKGIKRAMGVKEESDVEEATEAPKPKEQPKVSPEGQKMLNVQKMAYETLKRLVEKSPKSFPRLAKMMGLKVKE